MPAKWTLQIAPGTKLLTIFGSLCARAHPEKNEQEIGDKNNISFETKKSLSCIWNLKISGVTLQIYIDWLIRLGKKEASQIIPNELLSQFDISNRKICNIGMRGRDKSKFHPLTIHSMENEQQFARSSFLSAQNTPLHDDFWSHLSLPFCNSGISAPFPEL